MANGGWRDRIISRTFIKRMKKALKSPPRRRERRRKQQSKTRRPLNKYLMNLDGEQRLSAARKRGETLLRQLLVFSADQAERYQKRIIESAAFRSRRKSWPPLFYPDSWDFKFSRLESLPKLFSATERARKYITPLLSLRRVQSRKLLHRAPAPTGTHPGHPAIPPPLSLSLSLSLSLCLELATLSADLFSPRP